MAQAHGDLGEVFLQTGPYLLPRTDDPVRRLKMLENDIAGANGESMILALDQTQENKVIERFKADRNETCVEFLDKCEDLEREVTREIATSHYSYAEQEENDVDMKKLHGWLAKIRKLDFYGAESAVEAEERLKVRAAALDAYARSVFAARRQTRPEQAEREGRRHD